MNSVSVVILAAGRGKRMYSDLPKVLHPLGTQMRHTPNFCHVSQNAICWGLLGCYLT